MEVPSRAQISAPSSFFVIEGLFVWLASHFLIRLQCLLSSVLLKTSFFIIAVPDASIFMCLYNALALISCFLSILPLEKKLSVHGKHRVQPSHFPFFLLQLLLQSVFCHRVISKTNTLRKKVP